MTATVVIVGDDALDVARSRESLADDPILGRVAVVIRSVADPAPWSTAEEGKVFFLRAGDRIVPGAGEAMTDALADAAAAVGAHRLAGRGGWNTEIVPPSLASLDELKGVSVEVPFELSAIAVWREALPRAVTPAPGSPGGEIALLESLLRQGSCRSIHAVVAEVRMRAVHRGEPSGVLDQLRGVLHGPLGADDAVATRVRRRALEVVCFEAHPSVAARFLPEEWWGPVRDARGAEGLMDVLRDLHRVAARLAEARHIAASGFDGVVAEAPVDALMAILPDVNDLLIANDSLRGAVAELSATIRWLHEEVRARDEQISRLRAGAPVTGIESMSGWQLASELRARVRRRVGRMLRGGRT